jgi:hypothetical protein
MEDLLHRPKREAALFAIRNCGLLKEFNDQPVHPFHVDALPVAMSIIERHGLQKQYEDALTEGVKGCPLETYLQTVRNLDRA